MLRFFFCRELARRDPTITQHLECNRIDLVLRSAQDLAFVEFKFYIHNPRFDPYDGSRRGSKGGPGPANVAEFRACVNVLHARAWAPRLEKYVVLAYSDPAEGGRRRRYGSDYEVYQHDGTGVTLTQIGSAGPISSSEGSLAGRLYEIAR